MMRNPARLASCVALICICPSMFSCDSTIVRNPNVIVQTISVDPGTLNPLLATETSSFEVFEYIFDSLLKVDNETLSHRPMLAKAWTISPDHLEYTFWLRDDVSWHDGKPFTSDDVIFTFNSISDPRVDAAHIRNYFVDLQKIEKIDDHAVKFVFSRPYFKAISVIAQTKIIPKHVFADLDGFNSNPAGRRPIGTGPFRFVRWDSGRRIELARFDGYYAEKSALDGIVFKVVPNKITAFALLKKGAVDAGDISSLQWIFQTEGAAFDENFTRHKFHPPNFSFIGWNMRKGCFADRRVRQAMTMLVDRDKIKEKVLFGLPEIITGPFYIYGPNYDDSIKPYPYDPAAAAKLLDEAGWTDHDGDGLRDRDGVPFRFTYLFRSGDRFSRSVGLILKGELAKVGIAMDMMQLEWVTMVGKIMRRDFDAASMAFALPVQEDPYAVWHSSQAEKGSNFLGLKDGRIDSILEAARLEFDDSKRAAMYRDVQRILYEEQPCTFLFSMPTLLAAARRFENVRDYKIAPDILEWGVAPWPVLKEW